MTDKKYNELLDELMIRHLSAEELFKYLQHGELDTLAQDVVAKRLKQLNNETIQLD